MSRSSYLREALNYGADDELGEITDLYVTLAEEVFSRLSISLEGNWREVDSVWSVRLDAADPQIKAKRHVHIAKTKHRSSKTMQVAWNDDGSRHDKKTFDANLGRNKKVRALARKILQLDETISLESSGLGHAVKCPLQSSASIFSDDGKEVSIAFFIDRASGEIPASFRW